MTIWILALLCVGLAGYAGYARGIIRVAMSLLGILLGLVLAPVFGPTLAPLMRMAISNVLLADALAPLAVFLMVTIAFKVGAASIHNKVEYHFRYKTTDTKLLHYERLIARLGASLGLLNGTLYFYVLCTVFYIAGYLTTQITTAENATVGTRLINHVSAELNGSGMEKAIVAIDPMPPAYYDAADILGHVYHNRLLMSRLSRYPYFLSLAERPELQDIASDPQASELLQTSATVGEILAHPKIKALLNNAAIIDELKQLDVADLKVFVETGESPKYAPTRILGRWAFDISASLEQTRLAQPGMSARRSLELNRELGAAFLDASFTATTDGQVFLKSVPPAPPLQPGQPIQPFVPGPQKNVATGTWSETGGSYTVTTTPSDPHPLYQFLNGPARVRFVDQALFLQFTNNVVLGFGMEL
jgi:hypothetical protein